MYTTEEKQHSEIIATSVDLEVGVTIKEVLKDETTNDGSVNNKKSECSSEEACVKCCAGSVITIILSPFVICDLYFATTDDSCSYQIFNNLAIDMHSYLLASGIIGVIFISTINFKMSAIKLEDNPERLITNLKDYDDSKPVCLYFAEWICKAFHISWLLVGCALFWGYMDTSKCSKPIYNYLFARFIMMLVGILSLKNNDE